ncbi:MAG: hypothetical protein ACRDTA_16250 [Pseudonocardiaceae bacterium]
MRNAFAAVLDGLRFRPSVWLVCGLGWVLYGAFSARGIPYIIYHVGDTSYRQQLLDGVLPGALPGSLVAPYPLFGAIFMVALGGLVVGNEYRWGTIGTLLVQRPSRTALLLAQAAALAIVTLATALLYSVVNGLAAVAIAQAEGASLTMPGALPLLAALGGAWLIAFVYAMIGMFAAHLFRSAIAAIVTALVLVVGIENTVGLLAGFAPGLRVMQYLLPGPSGGAIASALGAPEGTPGLVAIAPVGAAIAVLLVWAMLCITGSATVLRNRDITA